MAYHRKQQQRRPQKRQHRTLRATPKKHMDINCDIGQGLGILQNSHEEQVLPYVTSINIACGMHTGDPNTMAKVIDSAKKYNVNFGALIGYPDLIGNGQREMYLPVDELRAMVLYQLGGLNALLHARGIEMTHVRAHGFLYKQLYTDQLVAETVAKAISEFSSWITLIGLSGPVLANACANANIRMAREIIIDRRYRRDGTILPLNKIINKKSYLEDASTRAREFLNKGTITCEDGSKIISSATTMHIPSDNEVAVELARTVWSLVPEPRQLHTGKYSSYFTDPAELKN